MAMMKRITLFLLTNILVMITISIVGTIVMRLLGVDMSATGYGQTLDIKALAVFSLIWGFAGSLISLMISRVVAKYSMGVKLIDPNTSSPDERWLLQSVYSMAKQVGIRTMPQVGIYASSDLNAFATGPTKNRALVAVSTGLLNSMTKEEVEGVLGHEVSHIANGDMVTLTLIQGIVNAFVIFFARIISFALTQGNREEGRGGGGAQFLITMLLEVMFSFLGMIVISYFSRIREFRADKGSARLVGTNKMAQALRALQRAHEGPAVDSHDAAQQPALQAFMIRARKGGGLAALFSSHPPLAERIRRLEAARIG